MSFLTRKNFLNVAIPTIQTKRYRGKINIQRPKPPHFEKATYLALAKPFFPKQKEDVCDKYIDIWKKSNVENPFQRLLANELIEKLKSSLLVAFYHRNTMSGEDQFKAQVLFHRENMSYKTYGHKTLKMAVNGTPYEIATKFYVSHNIMVFSPELKIKELLKVSRKVPKLILLAAIVEGKFLSVEDLAKYSLIPNLQTAQAEFVQTLNSIGGLLVSQLNVHQNTLVSHLQERMKQLEQEKA